MTPLRLQILGSGDAFGSGGRFNACFHLRHPLGELLLDCGASSMIALRKFAIDPDPIDAILVSHLHGDHFGGIPFFLVQARLARSRSLPLLLAGPPGLQRRLDQALDVFFPGASTANLPFPLHFLELHPERPADLQGLTVTPFEVEHPSGAPAFALRILCDGKTLAYTGDAQWTDNILKAAAEADLLLAECSELDRKVRYHMDFQTWRANLPRLSARRVLFTHMGASMLAAKDSLPGEFAEDGKIIEL